MFIVMYMLETAPYKVQAGQVNQYLLISGVEQVIKDIIFMLTHNPLPPLLDYPTKDLIHLHPSIVSFPANMSMHNPDSIHKGMRRGQNPQENRCPIIVSLGLRSLYQGINFI